MPRPRPISMILIVLALVLLGVAGPAGAHGDRFGDGAPASPAPVAIDAGPVAPASSAEAAAVSAPPSVVWVVLLGALLVAGAWRRPRRALALALVLVLAVFAFESALHSVHHGLDPRKERACAIASSGAHLTAISVEYAVEPVALPRRPDRSLDRDLAAPLTRPLRPDQGRAPPAATV